jgi:hypothetical protein
MILRSARDWPDRRGNTGKDALMFPIARRTLLVAAGLLAARPLLRSAIAAEIDPTGGSPIPIPFLR